MTREEAIQELQNCKGLIKQDGQDYLDERDIPIIDMAIEALQDRPTGKWVDNGIPDSILSKCSNCGYTAGAFSMNYCPSCGARMKEENNENGTL